MVAGESLKALHLWDSVAHNNLTGVIATSHELPKQEERCMKSLVAMEKKGLVNLLYPTCHHTSNR